MALPVKRLVRDSVVIEEIKEVRINVSETKNLGLFDLDRSHTELLYQM